MGDKDVDNINLAGKKKIFSNLVWVRRYSERKKSTKDRQFSRASWRTVLVQPVHVVCKLPPAFLVG